MKLNLGCGDIRLLGYTNVDANPKDNPDVLIETVVDLPFKANYADEIRLDAVFEHLWYEEQVPALKEWHRVLKPEGVLVINWLPDFEEIAKAYVEKRKPGIASGKFDLYEVYRYTHGEYHKYRNYRGLLQLHKDIFDTDKVKEIFNASGGYKDLSIEKVVYKEEPFPVCLNIKAVVVK